MTVPRAFPGSVARRLQREPCPTRDRVGQLGHLRLGRSGNRVGARVKAEGGGWRSGPRNRNGAPMRVLPSLICSIPLLVACAPKSRDATEPPADYYGGAAAAEAPAGDADYADASAAPVSAADVSGTSPAPVPPSAVMGTVAPTSTKADASASSGSGKGDKAIADMPTMGDDSIDQMIIFTGQLSLEVEFSATSVAIDDAVAIAVGAGGYVAEMTDTTLRLRVPSKRFRRAMKSLEELGEVRSRGVQAVDVSEEFNDLQVRLDNLKATRKRIEKLLSQTKDLNQILVVEKELQRVTVEIDRIEGRMRLLSSQAAFSTISMAFTERPQPQEQLEVASGGEVHQPPPPPPPKTLAASAPWMGEVGVHRLMRID